MKVSVLIPTRKSVKPLVDCINSFLNTFSDENEIEFLLRFDEDDLDTIKNVKELVAKEIPNLNKVKIMYFIGQRYGYTASDYYIRELAYKSDGDWLFIIGDDGFMQTKNWDKLFEKYNNQAVFWSTPLFFVISRKVFGLWGRIGITNRCDTWVNYVNGTLKSMGYQVSLNVLDFKLDILHKHVNNINDDKKIEFESKTYQPEYFSLENELLRIRDVNVLANYVDETNYVNDQFLQNFEKKKNEMLLYHHNDQINLQKKEYELMTKLKPEIFGYPLFKMLCHLIPFQSSVPHAYTLMKLARYSKIGILEIGTGQGETALSLGIGATSYSVRSNKNKCKKIITVNDVQPEKQAIGYFELFKEFLPPDKRIIKSNQKDFSFNEPIDLLFINKSDTIENIYSNCNKYIPLVEKDGIVVITDTGSVNVISSVTRFLNENKDNIKYELLPFDSINHHPKFQYNNVSMCAIKIL